MFTTRSGGVSAGPWTALNLGLHLDDEPGRVLANRELVAQHLGTGSVRFARQVHGTNAVLVDGEHASRDPASRDPASRDPASRDPGSRDTAPEADALVAVALATPIGVLAADCLPVLFADPVHRVVAAAHAGRRGLAAGVLQNTVVVMAANGARADDIVAVIGPAVCGRCYEVPAPMRDEVSALVPGAAATTGLGTPSLDLAAGAAAILAALGVGEVRRTGICTMEDDRFYSYRREGVTGRFAGVVMLDDRG
jgi:hypothetical protein